MNKVRIHLSAILHNLRCIRSLLPNHVKIMGIVKSDAYGHGLVQVSKLLCDEGIDMLGVSYPFEAYGLVEAGIKKKIVILCGIYSGEDLEMIVEYNMNMIPVIWNKDTASLLNDKAKAKNKQVDVIIKVDTGMGRLGIEEAEFPELLEQLLSMKGIRVKGVMSHLSSADMKDKESERFTREQIKRFNKAVNICYKMRIQTTMNSLANSAGIIRYRNDCLYDMVRAGIILYGALPSPEFDISFSLKPAMEFKGRIIQVRNIAPFSPISYGRSYYTKGEKKIAILSAGYGNGIPRSISNKGYVLIKGKKAPIVGNICMDLMMCDVTEIEDVKEGDEVVFLGISQNEKITADDIARWADTISYEILCSIGKINKKEREYVR